MDHVLCAVLPVNGLAQLHYFAGKMSQALFPTMGASAFRRQQMQIVLCIGLWRSRLYNHLAKATGQVCATSYVLVSTTSILVHLNHGATESEIDWHT
jgi:hypothetical protein